MYPSYHDFLKDAPLFGQNLSSQRLLSAECHQLSSGRPVMKVLWKLIKHDIKISTMKVGFLLRAEFQVSLQQSNEARRLVIYLQKKIT